eukprot:TRINITY_DN4277_c0_g1_i1.p1 TRINITY_DN4277_c0_g1~~TRINITY_DN4277_c0_g1_i1.p1  ORF type:complete len:311 (+),score=58.17 TRINITY_DN4277_c0_g1_i1:35-967(+)
MAEQQQLPTKPPLLRQNSVEERKKYQKKPSLLNQADYEPQVTKATPPPKLGKLSKQKFNSTSTIFMKDAIKAPDQIEIIKCLSKCLHWNIKACESKENKIFIEIFSEEKYPLGDGGDIETTPSPETINEFLTAIFESQRLVAENGVMAMAYIERLVKITGVTLHSSNWRRIVLGALILASKVWEDVAVWNVDFLQVFPNLKVSDLNRLEYEYLNSLQFTVSLSASVYAKYYFELRALSDLTEDNFPLLPLGKNEVSALEARSRGMEENYKTRHIHEREFKSLGQYSPNSPSISIEQFQKTFGKNWDKDFS